MLNWQCATVKPTAQRHIVLAISGHTYTHEHYAQRHFQKEAQCHAAWSGQSRSVAQAKYQEGFSTSSGSIGCASGQCLPRMTGHKRPCSLVFIQYCPFISGNQFAGFA